MTRWDQREAERAAEWRQGLDRLEDLARQFQREIGALQQVAHEQAEPSDAAAELAAEPEEAEDIGS